MTLTPSRAKLAEQTVFWDAVAARAAVNAAACRKLLDAAAREEFTRDGIAPTWRIPGVGTVPLALTQDSVTVTDEAAYTAWVADRHPTEVATVTTVRRAFDERLRKAAAKRGATCDEHGEVIPGLLFVPGGQPKGISVRADNDAKAEAATRAQQAFATWSYPEELPS
jgi:hypothetical protein